MKTKIANYASSIAMHLNEKSIKLMLLFIALNIALLCNAKEKTNKPNTTITGIVTDKDSAPIKNCKILLDNIEVAITNNEGAFKIVLENSAEKIQQIVFIKEGYNNAVRNYNIQMANAQYNITLIKICLCNPKEKCFTGNVGFNFEKNSSTLTATQKQKLDKLIDCLKQNPEKEINIIYNTLNPKREISKERLALVVAYFAQKGIANYRIKQKTKPKKSEEITEIEIVNY